MDLRKIILSPEWQEFFDSELVAKKRRGLEKALRGLRHKPGEVNVVQQLGLIQGQLDNMDWFRETLPNRMRAEQKAKEMTKQLAEHPGMKVLEEEAAAVS